jgi:guanylate kinase
LTGHVHDDGMNERADQLIDELRSVARPRLFVISGPSGVGKDTLIQDLRPVFPDIHFAVTATTRERRPGEIDGIHYYFMTHDEFLDRRSAGEFLESAEVYGKGHWYGVPKERVRAALRSGRHVIVKVDVQGASSIRELAPQSVQIFVAPPSMEALTERLMRRKSDDPVILMQRLRTASREISSARDFDYVVFNDNDRQEQASQVITAIIEAELARINQPEIEL